MYTVKKQETKKFSISGKDRGTSIKFMVDGPNGSYSFHDSEDEAKIIAYGLNHGYTQHILGGFSDAVIEQIKTGMKATEIEAEPATRAAESFERDRQIYVPEERETVCDESGWVWSRWDKQKGGGQAFSGRAFLPSDASENEIVSRFKVLDYDGDEE